MREGGIFSRLSYANVMATVAVFIALGGSALAIKANSVSSRQIKPGAVKKSDIASNAVNSSKVGDGSLLAQDFASGQLPSGPQGDQGVPGRSALTPLQPGETERGVIGFDGESRATGNGGDFSAFATYPIPLSSAPAHSFIDGETPGENCTGTAFNPTAPPGTLCVYPQQVINPAAGAGHIIASVGNDTLGLEVGWSATTANADTLFKGTWAVTG
jgi:hypothetical protein